MPDLHLVILNIDPTWFATQSGSATGSLIRAGATALVRAVVAPGKIARMIIPRTRSRIFQHLQLQLQILIILLRLCTIENWRWCIR